MPNGRRKEIPSRCTPSPAMRWVEAIGVARFTLLRILQKNLAEVRPLFKFWS